MRSYDEAYEGARDERAFSNGTEWEIWSYNWCERCKNDTPELVDKGEGCPLIMVGLMGRTPSEWFVQENGHRDYHCIEFRADDEGGGGALPLPEPMPGQGELWPGADFEAVRMYADVVDEIRSEVTA